MIDYVYGLNKSGIGILKLLKKQEQKFDCWDDNIKIRNKVKKIFPKQKFKKINNIDLNKYNNIYVTPGISIFDKRLKKISKSKIKRDLDLYYKNINNEKIVAITGTNGKSTTTKLIGEILIKNNKNTFMGGNIGDSLCNSLINKKKYYYHVIELSSFQLETIKNFEPNISILLNLSEDHLDRYNDIEEYIKVKKNIFNSSKNKINIISIDDLYSKKIFNSKKIKNKISFSIYNKKADIYFSDGFIVDNFYYKFKKIKIDKISLDLINNYNIQSILVAYITSKFLNIPIKLFKNSINNFVGLPYRSSVVFNSNKILVINNSKATNINSSISSLVNKKNVFLIIGGIAKEKKFDQFNRFKKEIHQIYIYGSSKFLINRKIKLDKKSKLFDNLKEVIDELFLDLSFFGRKATILFSPACASYDQFENYEDRGNFFNKLIKNRINKYENN